MIDDESPHQVTELTLLDWSEELDLAVFSGAGLDLGASKKLRYLMSKSDWCTRKRFQDEIGLATCLYGLWGEKTRGHIYEDGLVYLNAPIYTAVGPLTQVTEHELIADMAEKELLFRNDANPVIKGTALTGGARDITGTSGSGLWFMLDKEPTALGMVLGRADPCPPGTHLMRFTPVWSVRAWLSKASLDRPRTDGADAVK
jgi:hypothetical protein